MKCANFFCSEIWTDRSYYAFDSKFQKKDDIIHNDRLYLSGRITFELATFNKHNNHVEWWKTFWSLLIKDDLLPTQVIIRWDFIGK